MKTMNSRLTVLLLLVLSLGQQGWAKSVLVIVDPAVKGIDATGRDQDFVPLTPGYNIKIIRKISPKQFYAQNDVNGSSPQSVSSFIDYLSEIDSKYLFDGIILVGDYPTPQPVYSNEPTIIKTKKKLSCDTMQQRSCSPSRTNGEVFVEIEEAEGLKDAILRDASVKSAIYNQDTSGVDDGLISKINNDYEMALAVRQRHPLFNNDKTKRHVPDSFWISPMYGTKRLKTRYSKGFLMWI